MSSTSQHRKSVAGTGWLDGAVAFLSYAYVAALIGTVLVLRFAGERFWMSGVALYLPRVVFGMPCLVLSPLLLWLRMPRLLWTQLAAAAIVVFPLMGFVVSGPRASAGGTALRVLSYNVESCAGGEAALAQRIAQYAPDVVLLQELCGDPAALVELLQKQYATVHVSGQFLLASRFPLLTARDHGRFVRAARSRTERFMRYELQTALGPVAFYSLHPMSPRWAFYAMRGMHVRTSLRTGAFWRGGAAEDTLRDNFETREQQLAAAARLAAGDRIPRILAGDTNLPTLSPLLSRLFGAYQDGFSSVGWGFGYTFPSDKAWMRLDRILASQELRFVSFRVACGEESDHRCVLAQLERADGR